MTIPTPMLALDSIQELESDLQLPLYAKRDIALVRGEGSYLFDSEGNRYLDAMSNYGVAALGHADPVFSAAMSDQLAKLTTCHQSFYNDARASAHGQPHSPERALALTQAHEPPWRSAV